jgi:hypothetical protein
LEVRAALAATSGSILDKDGYGLIHNGRPMKSGWRRIRNDADTVLQRHAPILEALRGRLTGFFDASRRDAEPFRRRPNISLRLYAEGGPLAKVIVLPRVRHGPDGGYLVPAEHTLELLILQEFVECETAGRSRRTELNFLRNLTISSRPDHRPYIAKTIRKTAVDDVRRIVAVASDFLTDARAVLGRSLSYCCLCGRHLTDETSCSRGVGPECLRRTEAIAALYGQERTAVDRHTPPEPERAFDPAAT